MKALILQMRGNGDPSRAIEQQEYLDYTGLDAQQIDFVDLYDCPDFSPLKLLAYDILFVGGISRDKATELSWPEQRFPFIRNLHRLLQLAIEKKIPALLSCGGFAIAGDMLGAQTLVKTQGFELGVYPLYKTQSGKVDILLKPLSDGFQIVSGHVKYFTKSPPGTELLLYSNSYGEQIPVHAFKVSNAPFYAFQGHPEISCSELFDRVKPMLYRKQYFPKRAGVAEDERQGYNDEAFQHFCKLKSDTSEAQSLLNRFVKLVEKGVFRQNIKS